jgi:hypothetical protein
MSVELKFVWEVEETPGPVNLRFGEPEEPSVDVPANLRVSEVTATSARLEWDAVT